MRKYQYLVWFNSYFFQSESNLTQHGYLMHNVWKSLNLFDHSLFFDRVKENPKKIIPLNFKVLMILEFKQHMFKSFLNMVWLDYSKICWTVLKFRLKWKRDNFCKVSDTVLGLSPQLAFKLELSQEACPWR